MLCSLNIRDFVIVDKLDLEFSDGFTALTGETGAGKSILIDALQLLFGARSDPEVIRSGAQKSDLTASFTINDKIKAWLEERELSGLNGELVLRRTLDIKGRSRSWINGTTCSLSQLKELSHMLVVVHGQHAHQSLLRKGSQLEMLDAYSGLRPQVDAVRSAWTQWREAQKTLGEAREKQAFNQAELERMKWFLEDMKELSPVKGEWARINEEHTRLSRYNDIIDSCQKAREALTEADYSALELVDSAISAIGDVSDVDAKLEKIYTQLNDAREIIDSASDDVEHYLDRTDFDEGRFEELDQRINLYLELARKYHVEPEELYAEMQKVSEKAAEMEGLSDLTALFNKAHKAKTQYDKLAGELSKERKKGALKMQKSITDVMQTLAMAGGSFEVAVTPAEAPSSVGIDHCEFLVAGHAGVPRRSLSKVASGGELARISLAIAVTDTMTATVDTLIFDEVDSGIGGAVAETVGRLLAQLGEHQQVLCVTHLPQVASCASQHFKIEKKSTGEGEAPVSNVYPLTDDQRVQEIARMLGGLTITQKTLDHAREMLRR